MVAFKILFLHSARSISRSYKINNIYFKKSTSDTLGGVVYNGNCNLQNAILFFEKLSLTKTLIERSYKCNPDLFKQSF